MDKINIIFYWTKLAMTEGNGMRKALLLLLLVRSPPKLA